VTKYNVASDQSIAKGVEGTHTLVYEDDSVVNTYLHKLKYHVVYGRELVGHLVSIYRPLLGFYKVANVTAYVELDSLHCRETCGFAGFACIPISLNVRFSLRNNLGCVKVLRFIFDMWFCFHGSPQECRRAVYARGTAIVM
jgi:hypothetical protein